MDGRLWCLPTGQTPARRLTRYVVTLLASTIFPIVYRGNAYPYMTVFNSKFAEIEKEKNLTATIFGATNQLFLKSPLAVNCTLLLDSLTHPSPKTPPSRVFTPKYDPLIRYPANLSNYVIEGACEETNSINNAILRQKLFTLTLDFIEPIQAFFQSQINVP